jgi:uncharacterized protein (TIGR03000 family)
LLTVFVPPEAKVYINGRPTRSTSGQRQYLSLGLEEGKTYPYTISVQMATNPQTASEPSAEGTSDRQPELARTGAWMTRTVYLKAGSRLDVTFPDDHSVGSRSPITR